MVQSKDVEKQPSRRKSRHLQTMQRLERLNEDADQMQREVAQMQHEVDGMRRETQQMHQESDEMAESNRRMSQKMDKLHREIEDELQQLALRTASRDARITRLERKTNRIINDLDPLDSGEVLLYLFKE